MKIKHLKIHGFRGFKEEKEFLFDGRLTLIAAPNSHGKTSISEALEWLIYGATSKVERADSKDEYKGSYRNVHLPDGLNPSVTLQVADESKEVELRAELIGDKMHKYIDGKEVSDWPFHSSLLQIPPPFILQHALKNLLLAKPVDRFENFARLLGFSELGKIHKDLISLCTKPPVPEPVRKLRAEMEALEGRVSAQKQFAEIAKELKKGATGLDKTYQLIKANCREHVPKGTDDVSLLPQLLRIRDEAVGKVFAGKIILDAFTPEEDQQNADDEKFFAQVLSEELIQRYVDLIKLKAIQHVSDLAALHEIGIRLLEEDADVCPLCVRPLDTTLREHIRANHGQLAQQKKKYRGLEQQKRDVETTIKTLRDRLSAYQTRIANKAKPLLALDASKDTLRSVMVPKHETHYEATISAIKYLEGTSTALVDQYANVLTDLEAVSGSIERSDETMAAINQLSESLMRYLSTASGHKQALAAHVRAVSEAGQVLKYELDVLAGTQDVSVLIDLIERRDAIQKKFRIDEILEGLKALRQTVDKFVSAIMLSAISGEFGAEVADWYGRIRTTGDPDVHFSGFDIKRTAAGGRVQIKAQSYGKDLVSAVSSLSESKLNALGLCISIAINVKTPSPFDFLIIDDPIQSWDQEHEIKFIEALRELTNRGKQVVLLSHNQKWVKQVREFCADINGLAYEITGFTEEGPHVKDVPWAEVRQRMNTIKGIIDNPDSDKVAIQHGEEEVRLIVTQLAADLDFKMTGQKKNPNKLNAEESKKLLLACGLQAEFVNKLAATFTTVDDAHHSSPDYAAHRDRFKTYYGWLTTLENQVRKANSGKGTSPTA